MSFFITLSAVATMLLYAIPAYALCKFKITKADHIPLLASILVYLCTPIIIIDSFQKLTFSKELVFNLVIYLVLSLIIQLAMIGGVWLLIRKSPKQESRIAAVAATFGNCAFLGLPLIKALLPNNPEAVIYSAVFSIGMNTIALTFGSLIISGDKKHIKIKKILFNPAMIGTYIGVPLFILGIKLPDIIGNMLGPIVSLSTPVCMFVLGMRLSTVKLHRIFTNVSAYLAILAKQIVMPLVALAITLILPLDPIMETAFVIISSCPVAAVVLNLSELLGDGQKYAADCVLLGTILSILTIPAISLLI